MDPTTAPLPDPADIDPVVVARPEHFSEGPVLDIDGTLFVSSPPGGYVLKRRGSGDWKTWARAQRANGHKILPAGDHLLCHGDHVLRLDAEGKLLGAAATGWVEGEAGAPGHRIRWPNDITLDGDGGFYFTESLRDEGAVIPRRRRGQRTRRGARHRLCQRSGADVGGPPAAGGRELPQPHPRRLPGRAGGRPMRPDGDAKLGK